MGSVAELLRLEVPAAMTIGVPYSSSSSTGPLSSLSLTICCDLDDWSTRCEASEAVPFSWGWLRDQKWHPTTDGGCLASQLAADVTTSKVTIKTHSNLDCFADGDIDHLECHGQPGFDLRISNYR